MNTVNTGRFVRRETQAKKMNSVPAVDGWCPYTSAKRKIRMKENKRKSVLYNRNAENEFRGTLEFKMASRKDSVF